MLFRKKYSQMTNEQKRAQIDAMYRSTRDRAFAGVPEITAEEVIDRQNAGEEFLLIDVRAPKERQVSMIPDAVTLDQLKANTNDNPDATIVCYCTIGGRSGQQTAALRARGIDAHNMPGSVLSWSHAGGSFVDKNGEKSRRVHVFNSRFDLLADGYESVW